MTPLQEKWLHEADHARLESQDPSHTNDENIRFDQMWRSLWTCAHTSVKEMQANADQARMALSFQGNQSGTYAVRLKTMVEVYERCVKEASAVV